VDQDHIGWKSWKPTARTISFAAKEKRERKGREENGRGGEREEGRKGGKGEGASPGVSLRLGTR